MNPTIDVDFREWTRAAAELQATSKRALPDFMNGQGLAVTVEAIHQTVKADAAKIEFVLGQVATEIKQRVKGKNIGKFFKSGRVLKQDSFAERIILKRFNETGKWITEGRDIGERAKKLIANRVKSIGLVRSGWLPAFRVLKRIVRKKGVKAGSGFSGVRQFGKDKGSARPAKWTPGDIVVEIRNSVPAMYRGTSDEAQDGLQKALATTARDMMETLARRLQKEWAKNGAKL